MTKGKIFKGIILSVVFGAISFVFFMLAFGVTGAGAGISGMPVFGNTAVPLANLFQDFGGTCGQVWKSAVAGLKVWAQQFVNFFKHIGDKAWWVVGKEGFLKHIYFYLFVLVLAVYACLALYYIIASLFVYKKKKSAILNVIWSAIPTVIGLFLIVGLQGATFGKNGYDLTLASSGSNGPLIGLFSHCGTAWNTYAKDGDTLTLNNMLFWKYIFLLVCDALFLIFGLLFCVHAIGKVIIGTPRYLAQHKYDYLEIEDRKRKQKFYKNHGYENIANQPQSSGKKSRKQRKEEQYASNNPYVQQQQNAMGMGPVNGYGYGYPYGYPYGVAPQQPVTVIPPSGGNTVHTGNNAPLIVQYITNGQEGSGLKSTKVDDNVTSIYGTARPEVKADSVAANQLTKEDIKSAVYEILRENNAFAQPVAAQPVVAQPVQQAAQPVQQAAQPVVTPAASITPVVAPVVSAPLGGKVSADVALESLKDEYDVLTLDDLKQIIKESVGEAKPAEAAPVVEEAKPVEAPVSEDLTEEKALELLKDKYDILTVDELQAMINGSKGEAAPAPVEAPVEEVKVEEPAKKEISEEEALEVLKDKYDVLTLDELKKVVKEAQGEAAPEAKPEEAPVEEAPVEEVKEEPVEEPAKEAKPVEETEIISIDELMAQIRTEIKGECDKLREDLKQPAPEAKPAEEVAAPAPVKESKAVPPIVVAIPTKVEEESEEVEEEEVPSEEVEEAPAVDENAIRELIAKQLSDALKDIKVVETETVKEVPVYVKEVKKEAPTQIIREVVKEVPVVKEVVKEVPVVKEVVKEVPVEKEVVKEVVKEVPVVKEVIKEVPVEKEVVKEVVKEVPAPAPVVEEAPVEEPVKKVLIKQPDVRGKEKEIKKVEAVKLNFTEKVLTSDPEIIAAYNSLKNLLVSYGLKDRVSNNGDTFRFKKNTYCKITMSGSHLKLYLALDPKNYLNSAIPVGDASGKDSYKEIPLAFRVKSDLSLRRARDLIVDCMNTNGIAKVADEGTVDYVSELKNL